MRIFLVTPTSYPINNFSVVRFTGTELELYFNNNLISSTPASSGECFYVEPKGQKKAPIITKAVMPETRGRKIAWALDFIGDKKWANSFKEFQSNSFKFIDHHEVNASMCAMKEEQYGIAMAHKITDSDPKMKPVLAWISDEITDESLKNLVELFSSYRRIYCGVDFLKLL